MRRYRFRLDQVLRVRRIEEDRERAELLGARRAAGQAAATEADRRRALEALSTDGGDRTGVDWIADRQHRHALATAVADAGRARAEADAAVGRQLAAYGVAAGRVTALERLDERGREEHAVEARRDEDRVVDDVVVSRARAAS